MKVRVRHSSDGPWVVQHPELPGEALALRPDDAYDDDHIIVRTYPWAFAADNDESVEAATAAPGEKRNAVRR